MTEIVLQTLGFLASVIIFYRAESVLNRMATRCRLLVRLSFLALAVGAVTFAVRITQGFIPSIGGALTFTGMALFLLSERRLLDFLRIDKND